MPAPYTIEQTANMSGLSVKYIRRMKGYMPKLFEQHTTRGMSNALLFDEPMIEILKRTRDLKDKGRTLQDIRDDLLQVARKQKESEVKAEQTEAKASAVVPTSVGAHSTLIPETDMLKRENTMLKSQLELLKHLLNKAEERFDRLLPEAGQSSPKQEQTQTRPSLKSQMGMWLVEAVVVTAFAAGFIFMIWLFAQRAFSL